MAFIETTPLAEVDGEAREMYERQQSHYGYVPNYTKVFCYRPEIMKLWGDLLSGIKKHMEKRRFEIVTTAAAHALHSSYCSLAHGQALTEFFSPEEVQAMLGDSEAVVLSGAETAMANFARKVAREASSVTAADVNALKEHGITDAEIFDIAAAAAGRAFLSKLVDGLGTEPDSAYLELDEAFRDSLTVGRPIACAAPERLSEPAS